LRLPPASQGRLIDEQSPEFDVNPGLFFSGEFIRRRRLSPHFGPLSPERLGGARERHVPASNKNLLRGAFRNQRYEDKSFERPHVEVALDHEHHRAGISCERHEGN
jgi:hypothetical protein